VKFVSIKREENHSLRGVERYTQRNRENIHRNNEKFEREKHSENRRKNCNLHWGST